MTAWITCGLPYINQEFVDDDKLPPPPDVSEQERSEFGVSVRDIENRHGEDKFIALDNLLLKVDWFKLTKAKIRKEEVRLATENGMTPVLRATRQILKIMNWRDSLPEYKAWVEARKAEYDRLDALNDAKGFVGQGLNKPGTQIDVNGKLYLIGNINPILGVCDDCVAFRSEDIVTRYRVLITTEALEAT